MKKSKNIGILLAVSAAALYALNSPLSKLLLDYLPPTLMAGFLYLGAARTSAYYAIAPFIGALLSLIIFTEIPEYTYIIALGLMAIGAWLCASDEPLFKKRKRQ